MTNTEIPDELTFPYKDYLWHGNRTKFSKDDKRVVVVDGPLCKFCKTKLVGSDFSGKGECPGCEKPFELPNDILDGSLTTLRIKAKAYLEAKYNQDIPIISFDLKPTKVISEDNEDSLYWIQAKIVQHDGKRSAVVYIGEKIHGKQSKQDYSQIFIDIDDEQVRFDKGNKNPLKLLTSLVARFPNSTVKTNKEENE
jgi:hypothetical protein